MYPTRRIFVCLLLFHLNGFFSYKSNCVSAFGSSLLEEGLSIPGNIIRTKIRAAITVASNLLGSWKPLTIITPLEETCVLNLTAQSLDVRILTPNSVSTMTGGIFGKDVYEYNKHSLYWQYSLCNVTHNLESRVYYINSKYGSFEKALDNDDGIVLINFPIATNGDFPNPKFDGLSKIVQSKIKGPGDCTQIPSAFTYIWYVSFPYGSIYHTYKAKFTDEDSGKKYTAVVIDLPLDPRTNFISQKQFESTFGGIEGVSGQSLLNGGTPETLTERHQGICVLNVPA